MAGTNFVVTPNCRPWNFHGDGVAKTGPANADGGAGTGNYDGSDAGSNGNTSLNTANRYGQQHTNVGETAPIVYPVTPNSKVVITYNGGTVAAFSGDTQEGPTGGGGTGSGTANWDDGNGYQFPTCYMGFATGAGPLRVGLLGAYLAADAETVVGYWSWQGSGGTNTNPNSVTFTIPSNAYYMSFGINDTIEFDNTGTTATGAPSAGFYLNMTGFAGPGAGVVSSDSTQPEKDEQNIGGLGVWSSPGKFIYGPGRQLPQGNVYPTSGQIFPIGEK